MSLTAEKAEILGALFGDKSLFGIYPRYRHYKGSIIHAISKELFAYVLERTKNGEHIFLI